jgi:hypothetical protein
MKDVIFSSSLLSESKMKEEKVQIIAWRQVESVSVALQLPGLARACQGKQGQQELGLRTSQGQAIRSKYLQCSQCRSAASWADTVLSKCCMYNRSFITAFGIRMENGK